jgi:anaerobic nitric oxide reductase transcription regulator
VLSTSQPHAVLLEIARDLTLGLASADRYARLLDAVCRAVACDAACLLMLEGERLRPVSARGLLPRALGVSFVRREHPRLDIILGSPVPVRFPHDSLLPDPFDDLVASHGGLSGRVHDCMGLALSEGGEVVGALTLDAFDAGRFDGLSLEFLELLGALAGAALRTSALIEALERRAQRGEQVARELSRGDDTTRSGSLVGNSPALARLSRDIAMVAASDLPVLLLGETGVGKELVARQIHAASRRAGEPLIHVNCAALPESVAESELFGHVAGAFTGATRDRAGKFELASGATLFLDEVGELAVSVQPKLLRALQHGELSRVGSDRSHRVDVRVIAATNRDLDREMARDRFRADLFHRLAAFPLRVPPLRERREDIAPLALHFAEAARRRLGTGPLQLSAAVLDRLTAADWPGNVRELENAVGRAALRASFGRQPDEVVPISLQHLELGPATSSVQPVPEPSDVPLRDRVTAFQRAAVLDALSRHGGGWAEAARELGMDRSNLFHLARRLGISRRERSPTR